VGLGLPARPREAARAIVVEHAGGYGIGLDCARDMIKPLLGAPIRTNRGNNSFRIARSGPVRAAYHGAEGATSSNDNDRGLVSSVGT